MPKFFVSKEQVNDEIIYIKGQDVKHIEKVLRAKIDDTIEVCNKDNGENFLCAIKDINKEQIVCRIKDKLEEKVESNIRVTIFQGLPKADKMEYIIQKSVEIGAYDITPVEMKRCVVKLDSKDKTKKLDRWQKISEVAAKQCGRDIVPKINEIINIDKICEKVSDYDIILVAYEDERENKIKDELTKFKLDKVFEESQNNSTSNKRFRIGVVIGPEGGLEKKDVEKMQENGAKVVTLGKRILRTETVALNMLSIIMYELEF